MAIPFQVTFDANDTHALARFWATALDYIPEPPPSGYATWEVWAGEQGIPEEFWDTYYAVVDPDGVGPRVLFQKVPESKAAKNRVHLDLHVAPRGTPPEERARLREELRRLRGENGETS